MTLKAGGKAVGAKLNVATQADIDSAVQLALKRVFSY